MHPSTRNNERTAPNKTIGDHMKKLLEKTHQLKHKEKLVPLRTLNGTIWDKS